MFEFNIKDNNKKVHFIGIGGVSMSALAEFLSSEGFEVSGSDSKESHITQNLESKGIKVYYGHDAKNLEGADLVVYTDAIATDNEELKAAMKSQTVIVDRAEFLGQIMKAFNFSIAVSGTHGKTTTTSMLTEIIYDHKSKPTIMLGGNLNKISGNIQIGEKKLFLTEACEYKANIEKYYPKLAIVLNIDMDHLDYFDSIDHIIKTFENFSTNLEKDDILLINADDPNCASLKETTSAKVYSFGIKNLADYSAKNIQYSKDGFPEFDVYKGHKHFIHVKLSVLGQHNIENALAAISAADKYGIDPNIIKDRISSYTGVDRRLQFKGTIGGVDVIDDYAHHPTEIKLSLDAIRNKYASNIYCVFQPHTFTRTKHLLEGFASSFDTADEVIITDIYAAREKDYGDIHSRMLVDAINQYGQNATYIKKFEDIEIYLKDKIRPGDVVVTMGAGDVYQIGESLVEGGKEELLICK